VGKGPDLSIDYMSEMVDIDKRKLEFEGLSELMKYWTKGVYKKLSIFGFGCGTGGFLRSLVDSGDLKYKLFGLDKSDCLTKRKIVLFILKI